VAVPYAGLLKLSPRQVNRISASFGGGFLVCRKSLCGALAGMGFVLGGLFYPDEQTHEGKKSFMDRFSKTSQKFQDKFGGINCCDLINCSDPNYKREHCLPFVLECIDLIEHELKN